MPKRGDRKPKAPLGDMSDPKSIAFLLAAFLEHSRVRGYREGSVRNRERYGRAFLAWATERGLLRASDITRPILERYQRHLFHYRRPNGSSLSFRTQYAHLSPLKMFFKWLAKERHILHNPASELELPKLDARLPRAVLSASEVETVLAQPDVQSAVGVRDRAILEVLYSTGLRRSELLRLELWDIDRERGTLLVRNTKGRRDRVLPLGERAGAWLGKYLLEARPEFLMDSSERTLFLTVDGSTLAGDYLGKLVRDYVRQANVGKSGSCHLFRHTMATLMLEGGADIRFIQAMLGHAELSTTQIYTQVSVRKLQEVHALTHPAEGGAKKAAQGRREEAAELLAALDAEAHEEAGQD